MLLRRARTRTVMQLMLAACCCCPLALPAVGQEAGEASGDAATLPAQGEKNPYLPALDADLPELLTHLQTLRSKPATIRRREAFRNAVLDTAERALGLAEKEEDLVVALEARLATLQEQAAGGNTAADAAIQTTLADFAASKQPAVRALLRSYALEQRVLVAAERQADQALPDDEVGELLDDVAAYFEQRLGTERDLRLASTTVKLINGLPDDAEAQAAYKRFGELFARSKFRRLKKYGKQIAKGAQQAKD